MTEEAGDVALKDDFRTPRTIEAPARGAYPRTGDGGSRASPCCPFIECRLKAEAREHCPGGSDRMRFRRHCFGPALFGATIGP